MPIEMEVTVGKAANEEETMVIMKGVAAVVRGMVVVTILTAGEMTIRGRDIAIVTSNMGRITKIKAACLLLWR